MEQREVSATDDDFLREAMDGIGRLNIKETSDVFHLLAQRSEFLLDLVEFGESGSQIVYAVRDRLLLACQQANFSTRPTIRRFTLQSTTNLISRLPTETVEGWLSRASASVTPASVTFRAPVTQTQGQTGKILWYAERATQSLHYSLHSVKGRA